MKEEIKIQILLIILLLCIPIVSANATAPPQSIIIIGNVSTHNQTGIWWKNPTNFDFAGVQIWYNNTFIGTTTPTTKFYYQEFLPYGTHTFSSHTIDTSGNVNLTWINTSIVVNESCFENWNNTETSWCENPPSSSFTKNISQGLYILPVQFTDTSTLNATAWNWSFGDDTYSDEQNPLKEYSSGGIFIANLTVRNTNLTVDWYTDTIEVWNRTSNDFTANQTSGYIPFPVQFTDTSYNATSWYWMFGTGEGTSTDQNPEHTYLFAGVYTVNHSSSNAHDTYWTNKSYYITASVFADVTPPASVTNLIGVENNCTSINWSWTNPLDGDYLATQVWLDNIYQDNVTTPTHNFTTSGLTGGTSYLFSTKTFDTSGNMNATWVNTTKSTSICPTLTASFTISQNSTCIPSDVTLINTSISTFGISNFYWNVSNGGIDVDFTTQYVHIIYTDPGAWTINFTIMDTTGNTSTAIDYLNTYNCSAGPIPTLVPGNISQPQQPTQGAGNYTDIRIWLVMFIGSMVAMILARDTTFRTLRPAIFGLMSFILATASLWFSLSIAYVGNFALGAVVRYSNQSSDQTYYFQVIQVVASPVITIICLIVFIFVILNIIDIGTNYMQRGNVFELEEDERRREKFGDKIRSVGGDIRKPERTARRETKGRIKK